MTRFHLLTMVLVSATASSSIAASPHRRLRPAPTATPVMNLTSTRFVDRRVPLRGFKSDETPTRFRYNLPARGLGAVVGYKPFVDAHPIQGYEVNQATAVGFSQPASSVGGALDFRF